MVSEDGEGGGCDGAVEGAVVCENIAVVAQRTIAAKEKDIPIRTRTSKSYVYSSVNAVSGKSWAGFGSNPEHEVHPLPSGSLIRCRCASSARSNQASLQTLRPVKKLLIWTRGSTRDTLCSFFRR